MSNSSDDLAVCAVCFNKLVEPRELPCGHVFCTECLQSEINQQTQTTKYPGFPCPSCNEMIKPSTPTINQSAWAKTFPIVKTTPFRQTTNKSKHSLQNELSVCSLHKNYIKNVFCPDCFVIICQKCAKKDHPNCRTALSLKNAVAIVEQKLLSYLHDIKEEEDNLKLVHPDLLPNLQNAINSIDRDATAAKEAIKKSSRELVEKVKKEEEQLLTELETKHKFERRKLEQSYAAIDYLKVAKTKVASLQKGKKDLSFVQNVEAFAKELSKKKIEIANVEEAERMEIAFVPDEHSLLTFKLGRLDMKHIKGIYN